MRAEWKLVRRQYQRRDQQNEHHERQATSTPQAIVNRTRAEASESVQRYGSVKKKLT